MKEIKPVVTEKSISISELNQFYNKFLESFDNKDFDGRISIKGSQIALCSAGVRFFIEFLLDEPQL